MIGRVYIIFDILNLNIKYIGSTIQTINQRIACHKNRYKTNTNNSIYPFFIKYGFDNFKFKILKEYDICDLKHLHAYEQLYINKFKSINMVSAFNPYPKCIRIKISKGYSFQKKNTKTYKEKQEEIIKCTICNAFLRRDNLRRHNKTKKHLNYFS